VQVPRQERFEVRLRVPGWARSATLRLNGTPIEVNPREGYLGIARTWRDGDRIELHLPMPVERVYAHPGVAENAGRVALQRGPIVYCLEGADNPLPLHGLALPQSAPLNAHFDAGRLGGVVTLHAEALAAEPDGWDGALYRSGQGVGWQPHPLVAVPYATWDNRAAGQMQVWVRETSVDAAT
jgi:DUF1680 family protein